MGILIKILLLEGLRALYILRHRSAGHPNLWAARLGVPAVIEIFVFVFFSLVHLKAEHNRV